MLGIDDSCDNKNNQKTTRKNTTGMQSYYKPGLLPPLHSLAQTKVKVRQKGPKITLGAWVPNSKIMTTPLHYTDQKCENEHLQADIETVEEKHPK